MLQDGENVLSRSRKQTNSLWRSQNFKSHMCSQIYALNYSRERALWTPTISRKENATPAFITMNFSISQSCDCRVTFIKWLKCQLWGRWDSPCFPFGVAWLALSDVHFLKEWVFWNPPSKHYHQSPSVYTAHRYMSWFWSSRSLFTSGSMGVIKHWKNFLSTTCENSDIDLILIGISRWTPENSGPWLFCSKWMQDLVMVLQHWCIRKEYRALGSLK